MNSVELYEQLPLAEQKLFDEVNFLATELRDHLLPEQFLLAVEAMTARLQALHPEIPCPNGCFACCERDARPLIGPSEWELIQIALSELSTELLQHIQSQTATLATQEVKSETACPLLVEGRCSIYALRPLACRLTGYSFSQTGERPLRQSRQQALMPPGMPTPYSCGPEQERILADLQAQRKPLHYMFLPQVEKLQAVFRSLDADQKTPPRLLIDYLQAYFAKL